MICFAAKYFFFLDQLIKEFLAEKRQKSYRQKKKSTLSFQNHISQIMAVHAVHAFFFFCLFFRS